MATAFLTPPVTPASYHRIISPTFKISEDPAQTLPVGILACQRDPLLFTLDTTVVSNTVHQPPAVPAAKKGGKKAAAAAPPAAPVGPLLEVITHDTVIFPEGGGQPSDIGTITTADGTSFDVVECRRHGGHAVHYVKVKNAEKDALHFGPGAKVTVALGEEGFTRRQDHMTMHTGQHMLSALLHQHFKLPTLSWSLTAYPAPCYIDVGRAMTPTEIAIIQDEANKLVFEGRSVHIEVEEMNRPAQSKEEKDAAEELASGYRGRGALPVDYTGGVNRIVIIDRLDRTPCCGTQLPTLHNLQVFIVPHTDSSGRLYFYAGPRLINHIGTLHAQLTAAAQTLNVNGAGVPERVLSITDERRRALKRVDDLEAEVAGTLARGLISELEAAPDDALWSKYIHRVDDSATTLPFLTAVSNAVATDPVGKKGKKYVIVLSSSPTAMNQTSSSVVLVFGTEEKVVKAVGEALKAKGVKGGGKGAKWSGKFIGVWRDGPAAVEEALKGALPAAA
ncbi:hypothetical protein PLICRDRAFT_169542 [Plicaturopsis crispa FD-325 SS-3]|nr:hypothetical protein PLICRDRAFT_169542 [Plicaturopsis crispa FD-325 SS-3]